MHLLSYKQFFKQNEKDPQIPTQTHAKRSDINANIAYSKINGH